MYKCYGKIYEKKDWTKLFSKIPGTTPGADPGFLKGGGGVQIRSTSKKGGPDGGPILGPMLKNLHRGTKGGGGPDPLPPGSALVIEDIVFTEDACNVCVWSNFKNAFFSVSFLEYCWDFVLWYVFSPPQFTTGICTQGFCPLGLWPTSLTPHHTIPTPPPPHPVHKEQHWNASLNKIKRRGKLEVADAEKKKKKKKKIKCITIKWLQPSAVWPWYISQGKIHETTCNI